MSVLVSSKPSSFSKRRTTNTIRNVAILLILISISINIPSCHAVFTPRNVEHAWKSCSSSRSSNCINDISVVEEQKQRPILSSRGGGEETRGGAASTAGVAGVLSKRTFTSNQLAILNLLSGGVAGTLASCITNPIEVVKTQLQSTSASIHGNVRGAPMAIANKILETEGISGLWRGLPPSLVGIIPARSIYFYMYERSKKAWAPIFEECSAANALLSGLAAGVAGNTLTNPIWMVKTRMQLLADASAGQRAYNGYRDAISTIYRDEGVAGFYKGISASYWGCSEGCIQFVVYEKIKTNLLKKQNAARANQGLPPTNRLPKRTYFISAAFSKGIAAIATYPHEVARTRLREQARSGVFKYSGMWKCLQIIGQEEGRQGLYAGMGVHLAKVVPNSAIMFLTYEIVNHWLGQLEIKD